MDNESYADKIIRETMNIANGGFDPDKAAQAVNSALDALRLQAQWIQQLTQEAMDGNKAMELDKLARTMAHVTKMIDEVTRLSAFASGKADSRPDMGQSWMASLTAEQLEMVKGWLAENQAKKQ